MHDMRVLVAIAGQLLAQASGALSGKLAIWSTQTVSRMSRPIRAARVELRHDTALPPSTSLSGKDSNAHASGQVVSIATNRPGTAASFMRRGDGTFADFNGAAGWRRSSTDGLSDKRADAPLGGIAKRAMDLALALTALLLLSPLMVMVAALIKYKMGGPVIYGHTRLSYNGRPFVCYKFRSMVADGDRVLALHLASNPAAAKEWSETQKLRDDPRITALGRFLRKSSLDELPQLFNVIRGDMSCVGPRPIVALETARYGTAIREYYRARPGITGLWQISGRSRTTYAERVALDKRYVETWSMWLDLTIILKTLPACLNSRDAF